MNVPMKPFAPGHRFVKYDIRGVLGIGGHAHVYDAHDPFLDREVAVKIITSPRGSRHNLAKRAQSEARVLVRIDHPNVVKVHDAGATDDGLVYLVMEKLEGRTLREVYQSVGQLTVVEMLEIAQQICQGVHAAHEAGVIHRDLKPENVYVQADNRVKVLDFGISKVMGYGAHDTTQRHVLHGTVLYMSPEHLQGYGVTRKSDVFALGTLLYEGLYMHPTLLWPEARNAKDMREVIRVQLSETPPMLHEIDPRIFRHVARFVHRAILKAAEQRYESMAEMLEAARASWERLEAEQGRDFMVQWRRDLSRAVKAGAHQQPQRDTVACAVRFSTDMQAPRTTQIGGLTPPLPLTGTHPMDELPYQTTTPLSGPDSPRRRSSPPVVVVPPLDGPSSLVTPLPLPSGSDPRGPELFSSPRVTPTAAQSATLALAEQVTRTASVGIVDTPTGLSSTPRSPGVGSGSSGLSVAPVSHSSMGAGSRPLRAAGVRAPWFGRVSARVVVALGASLGLVLGVLYSVAGSRAPTPTPTAARPSVSGARPESSSVAGRAPEGAAQRKLEAPAKGHGEGPATGEVATGLAAPSASSAMASALPTPVLAAPESPPGAPSAPEPAAPDAKPTPSKPETRQAVRAEPQESTNARRAVSPSTRSAASASSKPKSPSAGGSSKRATASSSSSSSSSPTAKPERESWLKPDMIYYPDDPMPAPAKAPSTRKPKSGVD